jgi:UDP-N-acetylmuramate dehydrogenase
MNNPTVSNKYLEIGCPLPCRELLSNWSTWRIGGKADYFLQPRSASDIIAILQVCDEESIPYYFIGAGSNILFDDEGFRGAIIHLGANFSQKRFANNRVTVQAGASVPFLALACAKRELAGLEHVIGIPGSFGGLVTMNGGSSRKSIHTVLSKVRAIDLVRREEVELSVEACSFGYRSSIFQEGQYIVTAGELTLDQSSYKDLRPQLLDILRTRRSKFPLKHPNCGSVFKSNPAHYETHGPPGKIIEQLGLKGFSVGGAMISEQHANFIINRGNATAKDVLNVVETIETCCNRQLGIKLEREFLFLPSLYDE